MLNSRRAWPAHDRPRNHRSGLALAGRAFLLAGMLPAVLIAAAAPAAAQGPGAQVRAVELPTLNAIDVPAAWKLSTGKGVLVGLLDTGVDASVPDLVGSVTAGPDYTAGSNPPDYQPPRLHGTYMASLIAGHGSGAGQADGVIGVAPGARVLSVRVILDENEPGFFVYNENATYYDAIARGIRYAVAHGAGVINMSLGSRDETRNLRQAVGYAISHNVVVVAAAGNDGKAGGGYTPYSYPASYTGVLGVAAVSENGSRAWFSDQNSSVVISAPGVSIVGAMPGGGYWIRDGTSQASALVAGVAALIRSRFPNLPAALVVQAIVSSASRTPAGGYNPGVGFGEVDAAAALAAAARLAAQRPDAGLAAGAYFGGGSSGPITVVNRDYTKIATLGAGAGLTGLGFVACVIVLLRSLTRRGTGVRKDQPALAASGSPAGPAPAGYWRPMTEPTGPEQSAQQQLQQYPAPQYPPSALSYPAPQYPPPQYPPPQYPPPSNPPPDLAQPYAGPRSGPPGADPPAPDPSDGD